MKQYNIFEGKYQSLNLESFHQPKTGAKFGNTMYNPKNTIMHITINKDN